MENNKGQDRSSIDKSRRGEDALKYDQQENERDMQPEGGKNKGTKQDTATGTHQEGQYDKRSDDATMHPSSADEG
jgi:hypothetical protein